MKTGYSILLGEYVDAEVLEYRDCEPFQVVCPVCSEPLFKVARSRGAGAVAYLSHYRKADAYDANCELRVDASASSDRAKHNAQSRNQKLEYFLGVFRSALAEDPVLSYEKGMSAGHKRHERAKAFKVFRTAVLESARRRVKKGGGLANYELFKEYAEDYKNEVGEMLAMAITGFSMSTQVRIAYDLMQLLLTRNGEPNFNALFNHAALFLEHRYTIPVLKESAEWVEVVSNLIYYLSGLVDCGSRVGMETLAEMRKRPLQPPFVLQPSNYFHKLAADVAHEMVGTLVRLPYFSLLKRRGAAAVPR